MISISIAQSERWTGRIFRQVGVLILRTYVAMTMTFMDKLRGRVALVTGGNGGIGLTRSGPKVHTSLLVLERRNRNQVAQVEPDERGVKQVFHRRHNFCGKVRVIKTSDFPKVGCSRGRHQRKLDHCAAMAI
jgi:hypothetical protein